MLTSCLKESATGWGQFSPGFFLRALNFQGWSPQSPCRQCSHGNSIFPVLSQSCGCSSRVLCLMFLHHTAGEGFGIPATSSVRLGVNSCWCQVGYLQFRSRLCKQRCSRGLATRVGLFRRKTDVHNQNSQVRESWGSCFAGVIEECWHQACLAPLLGQEDLPSQSLRLSKFSNASFFSGKAVSLEWNTFFFFSCPKQKIVTENVIANTKYWR